MDEVVPVWRKGRVTLGVCVSSRTLYRSPWVQALATFFAYFNTWGLILAYGDLQAHYQNELLQYKSPSDLSWVATTCSFLLLLGGALTGPLFDRGLFCSMITTGSFLLVFGCMMLSLSHEYYQVLLSQGFCIGLGMSLIWIPSLANLAASFPPQRRSLPMGIAASGSSIGGVVFPLAFRRLNPLLGFSWTIRILGFILLVTSAIMLVSNFPQRHMRSSTRRVLWDKSAFVDKPYLAMAGSGMFTLIAYYVPTIFLPQYASAKIANLGPPENALELLAIVNGASAFGRIGAGWLSSTLGAMDTYIYAMLVSTALLFSWISITTYAEIVAWCIIWGIFTGVIVSATGAIIPKLSPSVEVIGARMGMAWIPASIGILIGSPIGGLLITDDGSTWRHLQAFTGTAMAVAVCLCFIPWLHLGFCQRA